MKLNQNLSYSFSSDEYLPALKRARRYALISLPWTINRMAYTRDRPGLERRLRNIILGKLPEYLITKVLQDYSVRFDLQAGETNFWKQDNFDILLYINGHVEEWDLKCLTTYFKEIEPSEWLELPALIPDRHTHDQWSLRNRTVRASTLQKRFLFVFLDHPGLHIQLTPEQVTTYHKIIAHPKQYLRQDDFILRTLGDVPLQLDSKYLRLVISAVAGPDEWGLFQSVPARTYWPGTPVHTRIRNKGVAVKYLPAFLEIIGRKKQDKTT